jgi:hypothetical protein
VQLRALFKTSERDSHHEQHPDEWLHDAYSKSAARCWPEERLQRLLDTSTGYECVAPAPPKPCAWADWSRSHHEGESAARSPSAAAATVMHCRRNPPPVKRSC